MTLAKAADRTVQILKIGPNQGGSIYWNTSGNEHRGEESRTVQSISTPCPSLGGRAPFWKGNAELCVLNLQGFLLIPIPEQLDGQSLWPVLLVTWRDYVDSGWGVMSHQAPESNTPGFKMQAHHSPAVVAWAHDLPSSRLHKTGMEESTVIT